jgi:pyruvate/2-oxoglutarate dehydrogenase complex dihydrolipoamide dehydrogenase (E3) component
LVGGHVSVELGQALSRLGSKVPIVDHGQRILKKEDAKIASVRQENLKEEGVNVILHTELKEVTSGKTAILKHKSGKESEIQADAVLMGLGRELSFESLQLQKAGIALEDGKIKLNDRLQTSNKRVFVSGDAANRKMCAPAAEMHNNLLLNNFVSPFKKKLNFKHFSHVTFTDPEVATFGLNEVSLKEQGIAYERLETDFSKEDRAVIDGHEYSRLVLFIEKKRFNVTAAKILGGSMVAPKAGEIVQELILANSSGLPVKELLNKIYPYPTAGNVHKTLIRDRFVKELKPWMKKGIRWFSKFQ